MKYFAALVRKNWDTILISTQQINVAFTNKKARVAFRQRALLLAKRTRSRAALAPTPLLPARVVTLKTGEVLPVAWTPSEVRRRVSRKRRGTRFSRESGLWAADGGAGIEHSVAAPRRLGAMFCGAPWGAKKGVMKPSGADSNRLVSALSGDVAAVGARFDQLLKRAA